jgi:hypothetical protein
VRASHKSWVKEKLLLESTTRLHAAHADLDAVKQAPPIHECVYAPPIHTLASVRACALACAARVRISAAPGALQAWCAVGG